MKLFDPTKPVKTRSGSPARILATDLQGGRPIVAAVMGLDGGETLYRYGADGLHFSASRELNALDLINPPEKRGTWVYLYRDFAGQLSPYVKEKDVPGPAPGYLAKVYVEWEE